MRPLPRCVLRVLLSLLLLTMVAPGSSSVLASGPSSGALRAAGAAQIQDVYIRPPQRVPDGPLQVVVALHGMGGNGTNFGNGLANQADQYGWLIVAPTIKYGDWTDPTKIAREDPALIAWLSDEIRALSATTDQPLLPDVLLFGHSRGAQLALRFTEIHPEQVAGVAAVSAGTYTLPVSRDGRNRLLEFPFGVANLARDDGGKPFNPGEFSAVPIWIGVGAQDNNPSDVPHAWDAYIGDDRRERAERFADALRSMGADVTLDVFDGASHGLTDEMRAAACAALAEAAEVA